MYQNNPMTNLKINKVMTVEELLMPRYKVIADYPGMDDSNKS